MARLLNDGTGDYLVLNTASVTGPPFTLSIWLNPNDVGNIVLQALSIGDISEEDETWSLGMQGWAGGNPLDFNTVTPAANDFARTTTGVTINTWHHACAVAVSSTDRSVFIDGGSKGTSTMDLSPANVDTIHIGSLARATPVNFWSGLLAEAAIWNAALIDAEVAALGAGMSPLLIRPGNLVDYWPIIGYGSEERDIIGRNNLTMFGTAVAAHPRVIYPARRRAASAPAAITGRIMSSLAYHGGLAGKGGIAGIGGGLAA